MTSNEEVHMVSASDYGEGSVTVVDDVDDMTMRVLVSGSVEFRIEIEYGDSETHKYVDDARGAAKREARMKKDGVVRALREANKQGKLGDGE